MKKPKRSARSWFKAAVAQLLGDRAILVPRRGCQRVVVEIGEHIVERVTREPHRLLVANVGDKLLVCGPTIAETIGATVLRVEQEGYVERLHVALGGELAQTTTMVNVLKRAA